MNTVTIASRLESDLFFDAPDLLKPETGSPLRRDTLSIAGQEVDRISGEFWTSGQRQASSLHEVSYRACFKPQLPAYFIKRFSDVGDVVYDPFSGRGTTAVEAALWGRRVIANDVNPLSGLLAKPRLSAPDLSEIATRFSKIPYRSDARADIDLSMFFHQETEAEIVSLKNYLTEKRESGEEDIVDCWIRMVATNRLTGHSPGFFSVYTLPPNQATSQESQKKINEKRNQAPTYRDTKKLILKKSRQLLSGVTAQQVRNLRTAASDALFLTGDARSTRLIADGSVQLTVTSPPFLDIVQYADDNWLRCWFNDLPLREIAAGISITRTIEKWSDVMGAVFKELYRITREGGVVAFEVGEVRNGKIKLEEHVVPLGIQAGFACEAILINEQEFTKTANIWGVSNNKSGTNTNRIVVFRKD